MALLSTTDLVRGPQSTLDLDQLNMAGREGVSKATYRLISQVQAEPPHVQLLAAACFHAAICHRLQVSPEEMHHKATRILRDESFEHSSNKRFAALRDYAGIELKKAVG